MFIQATLYTCHICIFECLKWIHIQWHMITIPYFSILAACKCKKEYAFMRHVSVWQVFQISEQVAVCYSELTYGYFHCILLWFSVNGIVWQMAKQKNACVEQCGRWDHNVQFGLDIRNDVFLREQMCKITNGKNPYVLIHFASVSFSVFFSHSSSLFCNRWTIDT